MGSSAPWLMSGGTETVILMTNHPLNQQAAAAATQHELAERVAALELFMQQLVFMLDVSGTLKADALNNWIDLARSRMEQTGSTPAHDVAALARLQALVQA